MRPELQARIRIVQSPANRWVKALRAALRRPPALARASEKPLIALEGLHLLTEALRSGFVPAAVFLRAGNDALLAALPTLPAETELLTLSPALFASATETENPQGIAALVPAPPPRSIAESPANTGAPRLDSGVPGERSLLAGVAQTWVLASESSRPLFLTRFGPASPPLVLVLAALQDPGNVGTLLRSAEAFGATAAILLAGTATPWSGKALRASVGSAFRLPLVPARDAADAAALLRPHRIRSYAAVASGGRGPLDAAFHQPAALWIGNEGAGLSAAELGACDERISLRMPGPVESLNAAVAGSLLLYEAARQRGAPSELA